MHRPVERHDGLAGAGRARDARRAAVLPFDKLPLGRVQKDGPLLPGVVERSLQRLHVRYYPEAALRVRMREWIGARHGRHRTVRRTAGCKLQQRLGGLARQVIGEVEERVLCRGPHVVQPLDRHAVAEQVVVRRAGEDRGPRRRWSASHGALAGRRDVHLYIPWDLNLTNRLADLDELRSSCRRMPFQPPSFRPLIRGVVMIDVAEQQAGSRAVDDQPDVATDPNGPEVLVLRPVDLVQLQARMRRVHLQVERRGLDRLLLVAGQPGEAVGEGIGDAELHPSRSMVVAARTLARRLRGRVVRGRHASRRVPHVDTRFGLSLADALEDHHVAKIVDAARRSHPENSFITSAPRTLAVDGCEMSTQHATVLLN